LNEDLKAPIPGRGYLTGQTKGIPCINKSDIPEVLCYACKFWVKHVIDVEVPATVLLDELRIFFSAHLVVWMEVLIPNFEFQSLDSIRAWLQVRVLSSTLVITSLY
jgi:hypothetical protein